MQKDHCLAPRGLDPGCKLARAPTLCNKDPGTGSRGTFPCGIAAPTVHHQNFGTTYERVPNGPPNTPGLVESRDHDGKLHVSTVTYRSKPRGLPA